MASIDLLTEEGGDDIGSTFNDDLLNRLRDTVRNVMDSNKIRADSKAVEQIMNRIVNLKSKYESLSPSEKEEFSQQMQDSFEKTISSLETNITEQEPYKQFFHCSLFIYVGVVLTFG